MDTPKGRVYSAVQLMQTAYLNGKYMPLEECQIPAIDRGFIFGDAVYEMIPVYDGKPFHAAAHIERLQSSCEATGISNPHSVSEWRQLISTIIQKSGNGDYALYLQVTRGCAPRDHYSGEQLQPTVFVMTMPLVSIAEETLLKGVSAITAEDLRWQRCDIKTTSLMANILLRKSAVEAGVEEAILLRDGLVTEASAANVFLVVEESNQATLVTAPQDHKILSGITRNLVLQLARKHHIRAEEREIKETELLTAQEIWLTSSTKEIVPVVELNGNRVGSGKVGELWMQFRQWMTEIKQ